MLGCSCGGLSSCPSSDCLLFCPEGRYIYIEADKFSEAGQSSRLVSRPFCAPGAICVEFAYHMYGLGEGAKLNLLLESPAGSSPSTIWQRVGSQSPDWLNTSVTIPLGHQQPMQVRDGEGAPPPSASVGNMVLGAIMPGYNRG